MFKVTREWIMDHRTIKGAWTYDQLTSIGVELPPKHGWINKVNGKLITNEARDRFEMKLDKRHVKKLSEPTLSFEF